MSNQFDQMGAIYESSFFYDFRAYMEIPSVFSYLDNVQGKKVFDFGCGTGLYSRLLKQAGAAEVYGYDVSDGMLALAKESEQKDPLGIHYLNHIDDALTGQFDIVLGVYVMPYAGTFDDLNAMAHTMAKLLKPNGQLLTLPMHPDIATDDSYYRPYGFGLSPLNNDGRSEGGTYTLNINGTDEKIVAHWWSYAALQYSLSQAGFGTAEWHAPIISPEGQEKVAAQFWQAYLTQPHAAILSARLQYQVNPA